MKLNKTLALSARKGFTLVELLVVIAIIAALAGLSYGPIMKQINAADRTEAISNGRSINTALLGFYAANDSQYPNLNTSRQGTPTLATSNDFFQQLIDAEFVDDEALFWNRTSARAGSVANLDLNEPDNNGTLDAGENSLNCIAQLDAGDGTTPIFFDSLVPGGTTFTTETWDGKAIIAYVDGSVNAEQIQFTGRVQDAAGMFQDAAVETGDPAVNIIDPAQLPSAAELLEYDPGL